MSCQGEDQTSHVAAHADVSWWVVGVLAASTQESDPTLIHFPVMPRGALGSGDFVVVPLSCRFAGCADDFTDVAPGDALLAGSADRVL